MTEDIGEWYVNGWRINIEQGRKGPADRRIGVASPGGDYCVLTLASLGAIAALWYRNEDKLYPPERGLEGGERVLRFLADCCKDGIRVACQEHKLKSPTVYRLQREDDG